MRGATRRANRERRRYKEKCRCAGPEYHPIDGHDHGCILSEQRRVAVEREKVGGSK